MKGVWRVSNNKKDYRDEAFISSYDQDWYETFVIAWQRASSLKDLAIELEMPYYTALHVSQRLRKAGIPLQRFKRGHRSNWSYNEIDLDILSDLC